jgi:xanthosine utilization system XapX-like protein
MTSRIGAGIVAGLVAGIAFGILMTLMSAPTPEGGQMPMMGMVAMVVGSQSLAVGWLYHLFNSAVIGGLFGLLAGGRLARATGAALAWGALYGFAWWVLGGLILMPVLLDMPAFAPLRMPPGRMVALGSLVGHLLFGFILGATYLRVHAPGRRAATATAT